MMLQAVGDVKRVAVKAVNGACDFCGVLVEGPRMYAAADFELPRVEPGLSIMSVGGWAACATCEGLIDGEQWDDLLWHALAQYPAEIKNDVLVQEVLRQVHRAFRAGRRAE